jgi:hypothetical protein
MTPDQRRRRFARAVTEWCRLTASSHRSNPSGRRPACIVRTTMHLGKCQPRTTPRLTIAPGLAIAFSRISASASTTSRRDHLPFAADRAAHNNRSTARPRRVAAASAPDQSLVSSFDHPISLDAQPVWAPATGHALIEEQEEAPCSITDTMEPSFVHNHERSQLVRGEEAAATEGVSSTKSKASAHRPSSASTRIRIPPGCKQQMTHPYHLSLAPLENSHSNASCYRAIAIESTSPCATSARSTFFHTR